MKLHFLKYYLLIIIPLFYSFATVPAGGDNNAANYISIRGSSNVNEFKLVNKHPLNGQKGTFDKDQQFRNIKIPVEGFTAENKRMVDDFRKMVNAGENPYIQIALQKRELADFEETSGMTNFNTIITIAGTSQKYVIPLEIIPELHSGYTVKGSFSLELTDFGIQPPEKLFGLVKVKNDVFITFTFKFDSEESLTKNRQF